MLTRSQFGGLCVALASGLTLTLVVADSTGPSSNNQDIEAAGLPPSGPEQAETSDQTSTSTQEDSLLVVARVGSSPDESSPDALTFGDAAATDGTGSVMAETDDAYTATDSNAENSNPEDSNAGTPQQGTDTDLITTGEESSTDAAEPTQQSNDNTQAAEPTNTNSTSTTAAQTELPPPSSSGTKYESIRNAKAVFTKYKTVPSDQLSLSNLTEPVSPHDNGTNGTGNFRIACEYSHFNHDDPIVYPGQPGKSHFHMYFGNTTVDANTTENSLVNSGGSTCSGFELNRSAYWTPAVLDGKGNVVVPHSIIVYYKTHHPDRVQEMPQGLQIIAGNANSESFTVNENLHWSCGGSGSTYNRTNRIPSCGSDLINASIVFPQCWDGKNKKSANFTSHMAYITASGCPSSHPVQLPQLTILLYYPASDTSSWYLSSDRTGSFNTSPGATLHADWIGGWNKEAMTLWTEGCLKRARNCSFGQTGTPNRLARINPQQVYQGDNFLPLPE